MLPDHRTMKTTLIQAALLCATALAAAGCTKVDDGDLGPTKVRVFPNEDGDGFFARVHSKFDEPVDILVGFDFENEEGIRINYREIQLPAVKPDQIATIENAMIVGTDYACYSAYAFATPIANGLDTEQIEVDAEGRTCAD